MIERVNPMHPDKLADRIAGAIVDLAYQKDNSPKIAVEILLGHGKCYYTIESSVKISPEEIQKIVDRIVPISVTINGVFTEQDKLLSKNQKDIARCGDNGIFTGRPLTSEETKLSLLSSLIYDKWPYDGKYILDENSGKLIICQSHAEERTIRDWLGHHGIRSLVDGLDITINPLGYWTGGIDCDSGATNRKLGSDMGHSVSGGGLHGKDMSKADVALNLFAFDLANMEETPIDISCAIGDESILVNAYDRPRLHNSFSYDEIVKDSLQFIKERYGGFEKFAEWGIF